MAKCVVMGLDRCQRPNLGTLQMPKRTGLVHDNRHMRPLVRSIVDRPEGRVERTSQILSVHKLQELAKIPKSPAANHLHQTHREQGYDGISSS